MRRLIPLLLILLPLLVACGGRGSAAPTPFPTPADTATATTQGPIPLTVAELSAAQGLYVDALVQVTGLFRKQPLLVCATDAHPSPASWGLADEGLLVLAGGSDREVRSLLPRDLLVTAEGRWRRWQGLVGCGKRAAMKEVWYLDVARIISPAPLTQVTLTPGGPAGEGTVVAEAPTAAATEEIAPPIVLTEEPGAFPTSPPEATAELPLATPTLEGYPDGLPTPTFPPDNLSPTPGASVTPDPNATPTLTPTPGGSPQPTVTGTPPTPTATSTGPGEIVEKGDLFDIEYEFTMSTLAAGKADAWTIEMFEGERFIIQAIAAVPVDLTLSVVKDGQTIIDRQNTATAGMAEVLSPASLPGAGVYRIIVAAVGGQAAEYAINRNIDPDFPMDFEGFVAPGSPRSNVELPEMTVHYWFFTANAGSSVTINLTPDAATDPFLDLYGPGAEYLDGVDDGAAGEPEQLTYTIEQNGLYVIAITEIDFQGMTYTLALQ